MVRIFVFIIGSFELPCYTEFIKMRKLQLEKYNISHLFLFDGKIPEGYIFSTNDRYYVKDRPPWPVTNELNSRPNAWNPHMILKFLKGIQEIDESKYDFIIRVNLSTFLNFPKLISLVESYPRQYFAGGHILKFRIPDWRPNPYDTIEFISGTSMIFSSDVLRFFKTIPLKSYILYEHNDDVVLSYLAKLYVNTFTNIKLIFLEHKGSDGSDSMYRIKCEDRKHDIEIWRELLKTCDQICA